MVCNKVAPPLVDKRVLDIKKVVEQIYPGAQVTTTKAEGMDEEYISFAIKGFKKETPKQISDRKVKAYEEIGAKIKDVDFHYIVKIEI